MVDGMTSAYAQRPDDDLLQQWRDGDAVAGQALVQRYFDEVYRFFRNKTTDGIDDLVQRTFLACIEGHQRIQTASFRTYMFAAAWRILKRDFEHRCHQRGLHPYESTIADVAPSLTGLLEQRREHQLLLAALQHVPLRDQVVLELSLYGYSAKEIAVVIDEPADNIRRLTHRARERVRGVVERLETQPGILQATLQFMDGMFEGPAETGLSEP